MDPEGLKYDEHDTCSIGCGILEVLVKFKTCSRGLGSWRS